MSYDFNFNIFNSLKYFVVIGLGEVPVIGWLLEGLAEILWPESGANVWDEIKNDVVIITKTIPSYGSKRLPRKGQQWHICIRIKDGSGKRFPLKTGRFPIMHSHFSQKTAPSLIFIPIVGLHL
jgi:hypothetical protein